MFNLDSLGYYEAYKPAIDQLLKVSQFGNTTLDRLFYDVDHFEIVLAALGEVVSTTAGAARSKRKATLPDFQRINLSALDDPEGCILVIDPKIKPTVAKYDDVPSFLKEASQKPEWTTITVTGVGSSALGSAAFAWNVACALGEPVVAIVPGYGLADVVQQALGGWFGYGLHDFLGITRRTHGLLTLISPKAARAGHNLLSSSKATPTDDGAPVFRHGSPTADILHDLLKSGIPIKRVIGHSKGALCISNAIDSLDRAVLNRLEVITFGCPVTQREGPKYFQFLGVYDGLGLMNAWGNLPTNWLFSQHTTNTMLPASMPVTSLMTA